jgi:HTH-type transcriptional regulator, quorum sensing regulator NprR
MNIGNIIKYHRIQNNWTQSQLCNGICSITHLSKIENHNKEADSETISLLLDRLGLSLSTISETNRFMENSLVNFINAMIFYNLKIANELYTKLKKDEKQLIMTENVYLYHIYMYRYYLHQGNIKKSLLKKAELQKFSHVFSQHERYLFDYYNGVLWIQQGKYTQSLQVFKSLEENNVPLPHNLHGEFYYQFALSYSYLKDSSCCISYAQKALKAFRNQYNYIRILHAQILLAINYTEVGLYQDANEQFVHLLRNANLINGTDLMATIHHNYAILCEKQADFDQAFLHYSLARKHALHPQQEHMSFCNLTMILIKQGKNEEALENIQTILVNSTKKGMEKYYLIFKYHQYRLNNKLTKAMNFLEKKLLPFLEKTNSTDMEKYALLLADHYAPSNQAKAIYFYQKSRKEGMIP